MKKNQNKILIVDDEPEIRGLMQEILKEEGYLTFAVKNAQEAQKSIADNPPDLVYLDIWMPDKDGVTLLKEWSESNQLNFPVIMISGHATIETAVEATRLGAFDFIEKPLSIEKLIASAKKALGSSKKGSGEDIALILKNNCSVYKDVFLTLDTKADSEQILFLNGEAGTEKEEFAKYIHCQKYKGEENFLNLQLNLLSSDQDHIYDTVTFVIFLINIVIVYLIFSEKSYKSYFFLVILGGSIGNLFDRLYFNAVPDFIDFNYNGFHWFIFNVADIFITIGIICLIFSELVNYKRVK